MDRLTTSRTFWLLEKQMNDSMATKHLCADLPNSLPGPRHPMSLAFQMSTSIHHTVASRDQEEGAVVAMLRSQLRADCSLWGSVDSYSSGQTSGPGFLLSLSSSMS